jgi:hypothetical protein
VTTIEPGTEPPITQRDGAAAAADAVAILGFVLLGRRSHDEGSALVGTLSTAWPFLAGGAAGWAVVLLARRRGVDLPGRGTAAGAAVLGGTVLGGMLLRRVAGGGTPVSFVLVATTVLTTFLLGWRAIVRRRAARRP